VKKLLKALIVLTITACLALFGWVIIDGKRTADRFEAQASLSSKMEEVMSREDYVPYQDVSSFLYQATIAVEDADFEHHKGLDYLAILRAAASQLIPGIPKSGGSTITQQVVKNLYGQFDGGAEWKVAEMFLASKLEEEYSKAQILSVYVNIINYGDGYTGIYQASEGYFGVYPLYLSDAQASVLAGIPQSPSNLQLSDHYDQAKEKQLVVLEAMVKNNYITQQQADEIYAQPLWGY
jgi:membrane peptidoglycan carboxypeptidase